MKKLYLLIVLLNLNLLVSAQNPELYRTWHLKSIHNDFAEPFYIENVEPQIHPHITFYEDSTYIGYGACTGFSGNAEFAGTTYGNVIFTNLVYPEIDCNNDLLNEIDAEIRLILSYNHTWAIWTNPETQMKELYINFGVDAYFKFVEGELSVQDLNQTKIEIYPNPTSDFLQVKNVKSNSAYKIYNLLGQIVSEGNLDNSNKIIVNQILSGIYILKINDSVLKFIKK